MELLEERVFNLEELMADLALATVESKQALASLARRIEEFTFQTEQQMWEVRNEAREFKKEMQDFKKEMQDFKKEMQDFKKEMQDFKKESEKDRKDMNRRWGELANKMGTMVEDLVAPSIPRIFKQVTNCIATEPQLMVVRVRRTHPERPELRQEWDALVLCGDYLLVNETRSTLTVEGVKEFIDRLPTIRQFFPEYSHKKVIGAVASLYVPPSVVDFGEKKGVIVLGFGDDGMDVLNSPNFNLASF